MITRADVETAFAPIRGVALSVGIASHGPLTIGPDEFLVDELIDAEGSRRWHTIDLPAFLLTFGAAASLSYADLLAENDIVRDDQGTQTGTAVNAKGWADDLARLHDRGILE